MKPENYEFLKKMDLELMTTKNLSEDSPKCDINIDDFCSKMSQICSDCCIENMAPFVDEIKNHKKNELFRKDSSFGSFWLVDKFENLLFKTLLGKIGINAPIFKYTNAGSILYTSKNEQAMTSVVGMNDATECMYADVYLKEKGLDTFLDNNTYAMFGSKAYITSFSTKEDDLTMWRLYGDDAKGIAYEYKAIDEELPEGFYLAPVSYANDIGVHKELDFVAEMGKMIIDNCLLSFKNLYLWKYFFKPKEYMVENEVRLLFFSSNPQDKSTWIETSTGMIAPMRIFPLVDKSNDYDCKKVNLYPLQIVRIWLGPRMPDAQANKDNIGLLLNEAFGWTKESHPIESSKIENYREMK